MLVVAKIKILITQKRFKHMVSLLASGSRDLHGGVMSYLLQADAWGSACLADGFAGRASSAFGSLNQSNFL